MRSADGREIRRPCHPVGVRRVAQAASRTYRTKLTFPRATSSENTSPLLAGYVRSRSRSPSSRSRRKRCDPLRHTASRNTAPCLTCASRRLATNRVRPSHSARHGPQPSRFLSRHSLLHLEYIRFYRSFFRNYPSLRTVCGTFLRSRPRRIDTVARSP